MRPPVAAVVLDPANPLRIGAVMAARESARTSRKERVRLDSALGAGAALAGLTTLTKTSLSQFAPGRETIPIENQEYAGLADHAAETVKVTGELTGNAIKVAQIVVEKKGRPRKS